jgi:hypothetical protein
MERGPPSHDIIPTSTELKPNTQHYKKAWIAFCKCAVTSHVTSHLQNAMDFLALQIQSHFSNTRWHAMLPRVCRMWSKFFCSAAVIGFLIMTCLCWADLWITANDPDVKPPGEVAQHQDHSWWYKGRPDPIFMMAHNRHQIQGRQVIANPIPTAPWACRARIKIFDLWCSTTRWFRVPVFWQKIRRYPGTAPSSVSLGLNSDSRTQGFGGHFYMYFLKDRKYNKS